MRLFFTDIRSKEVINISTGMRLGYVSDVLIEAGTGQMLSIIIPGDVKCFGLLGRDDDFVIPWNTIKKIGDDIILVDLPDERRKRQRLGY